MRGVKSERALWWALGFSSSFLIVEFIAGYLFNSLALMADAGHLLTDCVALGIAIAALRLGRKPADEDHTFGHARFEILASALNGLMLVAISVFIFIEAYQRLRAPAQVDTKVVLLVALVGLILNLISMRILLPEKDAGLNMRGAYLEVLSDAVSSVGVIIAALIMLFTQWWWVDSVIAIAIAIWILPRAWQLLLASGHILLEGIPEGLDVKELKAAILDVPGVLGVHDLHVWVITSGQNSFSAHISHRPEATPSEILRQVQTVLAERFGLQKTTLQLESPDYEHPKPAK